LTMHRDTTVLVWDLTPSGCTLRKTLPPEVQDRLWADLAGRDGPAVYRAVWELADAPAQAVEGLRPRLRASLTGLAPRGERIRRLLAALDSDSFSRRESASKGLAELGTDAEPALRQALAEHPSAEVRRRTAALLTAGLRQRPPSPAELRLLRAVVVLERIGT